MPRRNNGAHNRYLRAGYPRRAAAGLGSLAWETPASPSLPDPGRMLALLRWLGHDPDWQGYVLGYRRAIEILVQGARDTGYTDTLVFPLGALCRHAVELSLKRILVLMHEEFAEGPSLRTNHNLIGLWEASRDPLARLGMPHGR